MVPWLRAHRRNSSNPTSPLPPSLHSPDSPRALPDTSRSPDLGSARSDGPPQRIRVPSFSEHGQAPDGSEGWRNQNLDVRAGWEHAHHKSSSSFDRLRPASSAGPGPQRTSYLATHANHSQQSLANSPSLTLNDTGPPHSPVEERVQFYAAGGGARGSVGQFSNPSTDRLTLDESVEASRGAPGAPSRSRLNLLNPMSLLARRRSSQNLVPKPEDLTMKSLAVPAIPEDFNPSIRGTRVHDFSAPRDRRNLSSYDAGQFVSPDAQLKRPYDYTRRRSDVTGHSALLLSPESRHSDHSPVFKEHFNDDGNTLQVESKGYLQSMAAASRFSVSPDREPPAIPAFARNLPLRLPDETIDKSRLPAVSEVLAPPTRSPPPPPVPPKESPPAPPGFPDTSRLSAREEPEAVPQEHTVTIADSFPLETSGASSLSLPKRRPNMPSPSRQSQLPGRVGSDASRFSFEVGNQEKSPSRQAEQPKRVASNASRFSFDTGGAEKVMEERHKQKEAARKAERPDSIADESDEGDLDYDDFDDGLEERIPGINTDADDDFLAEDMNGHLGENEASPLEDDAMVQGEVYAEVQLDEGTQAQPERDTDQERTPPTNQLQGFHFTPAPAVLSPTTTARSSATSQPTPKDEYGQTIGFAVSRESPDLGRVEAFQGYGLGILAEETTIVSTQQPSNKDHEPSMQLDEDDLYFDDGNIEGIGLDDDADGTAFDETVFDDETNELHERRIRGPMTLDNLLDRDVTSPDTNESEDDGEDFDDEFSASNDVGQSAIAQAFSKPGAPRIWGSINVPAPQQKPEEPKSIGLTEGNLAAYHQALVHAANEAAAKGRFSHQASASQLSEESEGTENPGLISDDSRVTSQNVDFEASGIEDVQDDFNYKDEIDDDPIIAEANAEALENDDEGFYGQEFGFYARAHGNCASEQVNGGFFGPRGVEGVSRSHSGRANYQEPSLTPITERSEWSNRNSFISLQTHGIPLSAQTLPSPGLAQLVDMGNFDEDHMTLTALMKLRRGAWGGSNGSLHSSAGSQASSSPLTQAPPAGFGAFPVEAGSHRMSSSTYSLNDSAGIPESEEEDEGSSASPTITVASPRKNSLDLPPKISHLASPEATPVSAGTPTAGRSHSRNSSGTESISYVKEKDADGAGRWVLERRRTGDGGEVELIGREVLAGGRI